MADAAPPPAEAAPSQAPATQTPVPDAAEQAQKEAQAAAKRWKLGDEEFDSPDKLADRAGLYHKRAQEADTYEAFLRGAYKTDQEAKRLQERLDKDYRGYLKEKGVDLREEGKRAFLEDLELKRKYAGLDPDTVEEIERARAAMKERDELKAKLDAREKDDEAKATAAQEKASRDELVGTLRGMWEGKHTDLPMDADVLELAARHYLAAKLANVKPDPAIIAAKLNAFFGRVHASRDTDEKFDPRAYLQQHPKRADAIREAALEAAKLAQMPPLQQVQASGTSGAADQPRDNVGRWMEFHAKKR